MWAGIVSNSIAMAADAWHTLSDSLTSMTVIAGFMISSKPADERHPFGHGRAENIVAIIISVFLFLVGADFFKNSIIKLYNPKQFTFGVFALIVFSISILIKECMARFSLWAGNKINSNSLKADAWHHRSDAITTGLIVAGFLAGKKIWWVDSVLGMIVSLFIFYAAYTLFRESSLTILGSKVDPELIAEIKKLVKETAPVVQNAHHFHIHKYGDHSEMTFHVHFPEDIKIKDAHKSVTKLEEAIKKQTGIETTIHMEPQINNRN